MSAFNKSFGSCKGPLDFPMSDEDAKELEANLESGEYSPFRKTSTQLESTFPGERADISVISVATPDDVGDVIDPDTIDFTKFQRNPVVAYNHNYEIPPIGKSVWQKRLNNTWKAKTHYITRPDNYPKESPWFPDALFHMVQQGSMKGKSIGGAVKWREPTEEDATRLRFTLSKAKRISDKALIWEYSVCALGCSRETLVEEVSKSGDISDELMQTIFSEYLDEVTKYTEDNKEPEIPLIKSFTSVADFQKIQEDSFRAEMLAFQKQVPDLVNDEILRMRGRVQ